MPDDQKIPFDYLGAKKAGYTDDEIKGFLKEKYSFDFDITGARESGYSDKEIADYITAYEPVKKKESGVSPSPLPSSGQLGLPKGDEFTALENVLVENRDANVKLRDAQNFARPIGTGAVLPEIVDYQKKYESDAAATLKFSNDAKDAKLKADRDKIAAPIKDIVSKPEELKKFFTDAGTFDRGYADKYFDDYVKKRGGGLYVKETMIATMKNAAEWEKDKPRRNELLKEEYKKQGVDPDKYGQQVFDNQIAPKVNTLEQMKADAKAKANERLEQMKPLAAEVGGVYQQEVAELQQLHESGQIPTDAANAKLQEINDKYLQDIQSLDAQYKNEIKGINKNVSDKYGRIVKEIEAIGKSITDEKVWASIPSEEKKKIQLAQEAAQKRLYGEKNQAKKAAEEVLMGISPTMMVGKWTASGWNQGLADLGDYLAFKGFDTKFSRSLQGKRTQAEELSPAEYSWDENPFMRAVSSATTSLGASAPVTGAAIGVTLASGGLGLPALVTTIGSGLTAYGLETAQIKGGIFRQSLEQTLDPAKATETTKKAAEQLEKTLPLYFLSAVGLQNMLKGGLKKTAIGTFQEFGQELPTEYYQSFTEAQATQGFEGTFGQFIEKNPTLALDVIAGTLGQQGAIAGAVKSYQAIFKKTPSPEMQFYTDMVQKGGVELAVNNLQQQLDNDIISVDEYKVQYQNLQNAVATLGKVTELGLKGDNAKAFITFSDQVKQLSERVAAEEDFAAKELLNQKLKDAKAELTEIASGKGVYAVVTLPGGADQTVVMPVENLNDTVIKNAEKISVRNDPTLNKEIQEKKKELGIPYTAPAEMYEKFAPKPEPTTPSEEVIGETPSTVSGKEVGRGGDVEHRQNIHDKFREQFSKKGVPDEQITGALALMDARAKSAVSNGEVKTSEEWYQRIADVKSGEFESSVNGILYQDENGKKGNVIRLFHSTTTPISGDFRIKGKNNSHGVFFAAKKAYSKVFGDITYKVKLEPKNTLILNDNEVAKTPFFNIKENELKDYLDKGYDSIAWYRKGKLEEFIALDNSIIKDRDIVYQKNNGKAKGAVETLADGKKVIHALDSPDFSTMVHEIAHVFEGDLTATEKKIVKDFGGSESFARGFERYLRDGKAPTTELKTLFDKFKQWLTNIYKTLKGSQIAKRISPEIKQIFDRLLTEKEQSLSTQEVKAEQPTVLGGEGGGVERVKTREASIEEPPLPEGETIVTLSGMTERERQNKIAERQGKVGLSESEKSENNLAVLAQKADKLSRGEKSTVQANIRNEVRKLNAEAGYEKYKYNGVHVFKKRQMRKGKNAGKERWAKVSSINKDIGNQSIKENGVVLRERSTELQNNFDNLVEVAEHLEVLDANGRQMSKEQIEAAIQDVYDGIPSVQAENLLDVLEEAIEKNDFPVRDNFTNQQVGLNDLLGIKSEILSDPLTDDAIKKWLNEESELTPEQENILSKEFENILYEFPEIEIEVPISATQSGAEKTTTPKAESKTSTQQTSRQPTTEKVNQGEGDKRSVATEGEQGGVADKTKPDRKTLEAQREKEILFVGKPDIRMEFISAQELVESGEPVRNKQIHSAIKERYKELRTIIDCLWAKK